MTTQTIDQDNPTCTVCGKTDLRSWTLTIRDNVCVAAHCSDCEDARTLAAYREDGVLTSRNTLSASLIAFYAREARERRPCDPMWLDIADATKRLTTHVKAFDRDVWFGGLQAQYAKTKHGLSCAPFQTDIGECGMLVGGSGGRAMMTLTVGDAMVTVITDETSKTSRMGLQGIHATEAQAVAILTGALHAWRKGLAMTGSPAFVA